MLAWEKDLKTTFSSEKWSYALHYNYIASHCVNHWEITQKILVRWYRTPYQLAKMFPSQSPLCWRDCGSQGTIFHTFWQCKNVSSYWKKVFSILADITGVLNPPEPALAILHLGIDNYPLQFRTVVTHILITAKMIIARHWRTTLSPNPSEVMTQVNLNFQYERLLAIRKSSYAVFDRNWNCWKEWYKR